MIVSLNGRFVEDSEARVPSDDRGLLYGDGIFDTMRVYKGVPFRIKDHLERLFESARVLKIKHGTSGDELADAVKQVLLRNDLTEAYVRITVTRGRHGGTLSFEATGDPTIFIVARPVNPPSENDYANGISAALVYGLSNPPELARHKTTSYLSYLMARDKAVSAEAREAIIVDRDGMALEAATGNIFIVIGDEVITPSLSEGILPGIARKTVFELLPRIGLSGKEQRIAVNDLADATEIFITNSIVEVLPVTQIDGRVISGGIGDKTRQIRHAYLQCVTEYIKMNKS